MKQNFCKLLAGTALALSGYTAQAQGLEGIIVEDYYTISAADKTYIDGLGGDPINVGTKVYRIYVDMAPNYKLNTVFGSPTGGSNNPLSISTTTSFWNDINNGTEVPAQTRFLDEGAAFDTYITLGRTGASGGAAGCGSNAAQVGVLKTADTNGNLTLCTNYSGWPASGAGGNADGNIPGTSTALTYNVGGLVNLAPLQSTGNNFTVVGDAWATLPNATGVDPAGTNRVLIGQFTTDGVLSFHINVQLQQPTGGALESYVWNQAGSGEVVSPLLTYPQPVTGCSSSQSVYVKPLGVGNTTTSLLTVGDAIGGYQMVGIPDGLGAYDNGNGTFTLLMNHELGNTVGAVRAHGGIGAFVSKWVINKSTLCVQSGQDLMTTVKLWNGSAFVNGPGTAFTRFCSGDLPAVSAFYNAGTGKGTQERIYMNGEESGNEGRAFGHIATGPNAGTTYQLPRLGRFSWENAVAHPNTGDKTVVAGTDDTTPGQVYFYIGTKQTTGTEIDKAGLNNGNLYGVQVTGLAGNLEVSGSFPAPNTPFTLVSLGNVSNLTGAVLQTNSVTAGITQFLRPEDGSWDPSNPSDFYFVTTNAFTAPSRMWKLHFTDILNPQLGGTITAVLDGTESAGQKMMDNITIDQFGQAWIQEDPGNQTYIARMHKYDIATDVLTPVAYHDSARFFTGGSNFLTVDEESSGIIDMKDILGKGKFLIVDQAHYATTPTLVEGGQLLQFATGDTLNPCVSASISSITGAQTLCSLDTLKLNSAAAGTLPISYSWSGTGSFLSGSTSASALLTGAASGNYTLTVSNACGTSSSQVAVVVNAAGTYYADTDGDGFGAGTGTVACAQPVGTVTNNTDLCPADPLKQAPGACGCGVADVATTYYADADGDGHGDPNSPLASFTCIAPPTGYVTSNNDLCPNDTQKINPGACGCGNPDVPTVYYADTDGDGHGDPNSPLPSFTCIAPPSGYVTNSDDLCDSDPSKVTPGACGCGVTDVPTFYYADTDGDGHGDPNNALPSFTCIAPPTGYVTNSDDQCDNDPLKLVPGACGCGVADVAVTYYADVDGDGFGAGAPIAGFTCIVPPGTVTNNTDNCPTVFGVVGSSCDDGNVQTINDVLNASCVCVGSTVDCNDNDPCTADSYNGTVCVHTPLPDADGDGICDAQDNCPTLAGQQGDVCNDFNTCTLNDVITAACVCAGTPNTTDTDLDGVVDCQDNCPFVAGQIGSACNDGNVNTVNDVLNASCVCTGTVVSNCDNWTLEFNLDAAPAQTTWQIVDATTAAVVASGGPYAAPNSTQTISVCMPQGACFKLIVNDAGNDGIAGGGWILRDNTGKRIVDNVGNGGKFTSSCTTSTPFCNEPASTQTVISSNCDRENWLITGVINAAENTAVSAQWLVGNQTDDGYQFWFENPVGGYSRRIFRDHATSGGNSPANALRATKLKLNSMVTFPLPVSTLLNVRVRAKVNGVFLAWGPACRFKIDPLACNITKLNDIVGDPNYSCGATGKVVGASGQAGKIFAKVVTSGGYAATNYRFKFTQSAQGYTRNITSTSATLVLGQWVTAPLLCGTYTYDVQVQASFDNGTTYCPYGDVCTVVITNNIAAHCTSPSASFADGGNRAPLEAGMEFSMYPNPNDGDQLFITMSDVDVNVTEVSLDVFDSFGKRVMSRTLTLQGGALNTPLDLPSDMAAGLYVVNITAGDVTRTERLVIQ